MKLHHPTKLVFIILGLLIAFACLLIALNYPKLRQGSGNSGAAVNASPPGTCAPDAAACRGNAELCMAENLNRACN